MSLPDEATIAFNRSLLKLYFKFLKKEKIFGKIYNVRNYNIPTLDKVMKYKYPLCVSNFSNLYSYVLSSGGIKALVYSQLWRGYVIDNIDSIEFIDHKQRNYVLCDLKNDLRLNGSRNNEKVREILRKNDLKIYETKNG